MRSSWQRSIGPAPYLRSSPAQKFPGRGYDALGFEAILALELLERRRGTERVHADDASAPADIAFPAERGRLLDRDTRGAARWEYAVAIFLRLRFENIPGRH